MRQELTKQFVKKIVRKCIIFSFLMIVLAAVGRSMSPIVSNNLALGQMQNSDEMFVLMNTYNKVRPLINVAYGGVILWFMSTVVRDICKFLKINEEETTNTEKEN